MTSELTEAFSLRGRAAVVTGAAGGIGRQAAITFAQAGADVVIADVGADGLEETASLVGGLGVRVVQRRVDVSQREQVEALADAAESDLGRIDVWANVAGIIRYSPIVDMSEADLRAVLDVNLFGLYWGVAAAGRRMSAGGSIVNVASAGGDMPAPTLSGYGMSKAAVMHLTKTAAVEFGPRGVRVNAVAPGFVDTPMVARYYTDESGREDPDAKQRILATRAGQSPLGVTGVTTDITYAMLYLAVSASRFVTGQVLRPNGGVFMA
ncbi:MAG TPA: SDR family oxidoreductase [Acidimicrobiales bacterium]|nr:SDR family oxidoreductase [Acidimicrobiales bacterium]